MRFQNRLWNKVELEHLRGARLKKSGIGEKIANIDSATAQINEAHSKVAWYLMTVRKRELASGMVQSSYSTLAFL